MARRVETPRLVHDAQLHDAPPGRPRALAPLPSRADGGGRRPARRIARRSRIHRAHHRPSRTPSQARQRLRQTLSRRSGPTSRARRSNQERIRVSRRRRLRRRRARVVLRRRPRRSASRSRVALVPRLGGREKGEYIASPPQLFLPIVRDRVVPLLEPSPNAVVALSRCVGAGEFSIQFSKSIHRALPHTSTAIPRRLAGVVGTNDVFTTRDSLVSSPRSSRARREDGDRRAGPKIAATRRRRRVSRERRRRERWSRGWRWRSRR